MYYVYWVDGWSLEANEPRGGGVLLTQAASALQAEALAYAWEIPAGDRYGDGIVVVLDQWGQRVGGGYPTGRLLAA